MRLDADVLINEINQWAGWYKPHDGPWGDTDEQATRGSYTARRKADVDHVIEIVDDKGETVVDLTTTEVDNGVDRSEVVVPSSLKAAYEKLGQPAYFPLADYLPVDIDPIINALDGARGSVVREADGSVKVRAKGGRAVGEIPPEGLARGELEFFLDGFATTARLDQKERDDLVRNVNSSLPDGDSLRIGESYGAIADDLDRNGIDATAVIEALEELAEKSGYEYQLLTAAAPTGNDASTGSVGLVVADMELRYYSVLVSDDAGFVGDGPTPVEGQKGPDYRDFNTSFQVYEDVRAEKQTMWLADVANALQLIKAARGEEVAGQLKDALFDNEPEKLRKFERDFVPVPEDVPAVDFSNALSEVGKKLDLDLSEWAPSPGAESVSFGEVQAAMRTVQKMAGIDAAAELKAVVFVRDDRGASAFNAFEQEAEANERIDGQALREALDQLVTDGGEPPITISDEIHPYLEDADAAWLSATGLPPVLVTFRPPREPAEQGDAPKEVTFVDAHSALLFVRMARDKAASDALKAQVFDKRDSQVERFDAVFPEELDDLVAEDYDWQKRIERESVPAEPFLQAFGTDEKFKAEQIFDYGGEAVYAMRSGDDAQEVDMFTVRTDADGNQKVDFQTARTLFDTLAERADDWQEPPPYRRSGGPFLGVSEQTSEAGLVESPSLDRIARAVFSAEGNDGRTGDDADLLERFQAWDEARVEREEQREGPDEQPGEEQGEGK